jgi:ADP-heptose:LPS heptosyltransferase
MAYFHKKGYRVVLDTLPQFYNLFLFHYFKVHHPDEVDPKILTTAKRVDLNMSYESTPDRLHLLSYYEMAGIQDGEIRNPKLTLQFNPKTPEYKLFRKYCVLHIDERAQSGRNIYGVEWEDVVWHLRERGYEVIQIGQGKHPKIFNAVEMRNMNEPMLMRLIGGADLFIGVDSGPFNIALAMDTPAVVFFGSVHPDYIIPDKTNVTVISNHNADKPICRLPHCWSSAISTEGVECVETHGVINKVTKMWQGTECVETDQPLPPCAIFKTQQVIDAINQRI